MNDRNKAVNEFRSHSHWLNKNLQFNTQFHITEVSDKDESSDSCLSLKVENIDDAIELIRNEVVQGDKTESIRKDISERLKKADMDEGKSFYISLKAVMY